MPADTDDFVAHCTELFAASGAVRVRRMFGGHGFYVDDLFVALIAAGRLYLKADADTRAAFDAAGSVPFVYEKASAADGRLVSVNYFSAPEEAMESPPAMQPWARLALAAALRASAAKTRAAKPAARAKRRNGSASKAPTSR